MHTRKWVYLILSLLLTMSLVSSAAGAPGKLPTQVSQPAAASALLPITSYQTGFDTSTVEQTALEKLEPELRELAQAGGDEPVKITAIVKAGTDLSRYFTKSITRHAGEVDQVIGLVAAKDLLKVADKKGTYTVLTMQGHEAPEIQRTGDLVDEGVEKPVTQEKSLDSAQPVQVNRAAVQAQVYQPEVVTAPESYYTQFYNGVHAAWNKGYLGDGNVATDPLKIAVIDTGIDFANPDLFGTQARITDPTSPFFVKDSMAGDIGLPIAFDDRSMSDYALDLQDYRGNWGWYMNAVKIIQDPDLTSTEPFTFTVYHPSYGADVVYTIGSDYQKWNTNGGQYTFGWHPDDSLRRQLGQIPGVLVTGEWDSSWGEFDTIYVDILADHIFDYTDSYDAWATIGYETACVNLGWSAYPHCDISGGMAYFIANGTEPIPASDWMYGLDAPAAGSVVAFMINDYYYEAGGDHGMLCAGTAIGQGVIKEMPYGGYYGSTYWPPVWYDPLLYGGISQGPAKSAKLVAMGNFYQGGSSTNYYDFTALGYDGIPAGAEGDHYDQPHMSSNSYGSGSIDNDGWNFSSRYISAINNGYVLGQGIDLPDGGQYSPMFVKSSGNSGFGYGTVNSPGGETGVMAGVSTVFGTYNLGDTALYPDWVNWGDLGGFSDRGPHATGTEGPHVLANGFFGSGNLPLNYLVGGDWAVDYWSGTSRSGPEVMGILALIYDAYYEHFGVYPSWEEARTILMNGARTTYNDPFAQGAGLANALNSVNIIEGLGVEVSSSEGDGFWYAGNYRGDELSGFARGLYAGESDNETFTVSRNGPAGSMPGPEPVFLDAVTLEKYDEREWAFTTLTVTAEGPTTRYYDRRLYGPGGSSNSFGTSDPFYLSESITDTELLQNADLMVIRLSYPYEQFKDNINGNWWFLYGWAWRDYDLNGTWYNDGNDNHVRNSGEFPTYSENVRISYDYHGNTAEIRIREPWARMNGMVGENEPMMAAMDDILISARHFAYNSTFQDQTDLTITVELYEEVPWTDVELGTDLLWVAPGMSESVTVTVTTDTSTTLGAHTGYIVAYDGFGLTEYVPVVYHVWFPGDVDPTLGGVDETGLYDNGVMFGGTGTDDAGQRAESGDWRFFFTDIFEEDLSAELASYFMARTTWQGEDDAPYDTDIDTLFFGPAEDDFSANWPDVFGPHTLTYIGGSQRSGSAPNWDYYTTTEGPEDWTSALIDQGGLYSVAAQTVRWGGEATTVPYQIDIGTAQVTSPIIVYSDDCTGCTRPITFKTNFSALEGKGLVATTYGFNQIINTSLEVMQGDVNYYFYTITATDALKLQVLTSHPDDNVDADLTVYYWNGSGWDVVGSSGGSDSNERVLLANPPAGDYAIEIYGYAIPSGVEDIGLNISEVSGKDLVMSVGDLPSSIVSGTEYTLELTFTDWPTELGPYLGVVFLGPPESPLALEVPVYVYDVMYTFFPLIFVP